MSEEDYYDDESLYRCDPRREAKPWARTLYTRVKPRNIWGDLILSTKVRDLLEAVLIEGKYKSVLKKWGFEWEGLVALFSGPPGTGKTMAAEALASKLKKSLVIVRADKIHTGIMHVAQENIGRLFDEADSAKDILFIDEAEALLGQRLQSIRTSVDVEHNGNICVFLQRLEEYPGTVILATNYPKLLDPAMERRITVEVPFELPEYEERLRLWRLYLPDKAPLSLEADLEELARNYALTGSSIKNAARQAARLALSRSGKDAVISHADLVNACNMELTRQARGMANM